MQDINEIHLPEELWHGTHSVPEKLLPATEIGGWWNIYDPDYLERINEDDLDEDEYHELDYACRTAYGNIVYNALKASNNEKHNLIAQEYGLENLGNVVSIIFVSNSQTYVESTYGPAIQIDSNSSGFLTAIYDENTLKADSWLLVFEAGADFPLKDAPASKMSL